MRLIITIILTLRSIWAWINTKISRISSWIWIITFSMITFTCSRISIKIFIWINTASALRLKRSRTRSTISKITYILYKYILTNSPWWCSCTCELYLNLTLPIYYLKLCINSICCWAIREITLTCIKIGGYCWTACMSWYTYISWFFIIHSSRSWYSIETPKCESYSNFIMNI